MITRRPVYEIFLRRPSDGVRNRLCWRITILPEIQPQARETLNDIPVGATTRIVRLHGEGAVKRRIMDMGITKGAEVSVRKVAPLGDPIELTVRGYELSIRKGEAALIEVA